MQDPPRSTWRQTRATCRSTSWIPSQAELGAERNSSREGILAQMRNEETTRFDAFRGRASGFRAARAPGEVPGMWRGIYLGRRVHAGFRRRNRSARRKDFARGMPGVREQGRGADRGLLGLVRREGVRTFERTVRSWMRGAIGISWFRPCAGS